VNEVAIVEDDQSWRHEHHDEPAPEPTNAVLIYSDDRDVRQNLRLALGKRPAMDVHPLEYTEVATPDALVPIVDKGAFDLLILDGEAVPAGGMGLCRQLKDEIYNCPPIVIIIGRPQDAWLATWSRADGVIAHPIDAIAAADVVASFLREAPAS
jgi:DNA-binding response OmpR family regulator